MMTPIYNAWLVGLSILVAMLVSFTSLRLASRVASSTAAQAGVWLTAGAAAMGIGIWSMHFIGMLAFSLPIQLAYSVPTTIESLAIAVVTSGFALKVTSGRRLTRPRLIGAATVMGVGIAGMHYLGMAAIAIVPAIGYDPLSVAASIVMAVAASCAALWLFFRSRGGNSARRRLGRLAAAAVMGAGIAGTHYTGMAASRFASSSFCRGGVTFDNEWLATTIGIFALGLLALTLVTTIYDGHLRSRARIHAERLEQANAELQHQATHDALTGLPNRVLFLDRLEREIAHGGRGGHRFAVLAVDLDRFKVINDTLGHRVGDQLLVGVAQRLAAAIRTVDTVARTGGDEFLLLISGIDEPSDAATVAAKVVSELDRAFDIGSAELHTSASIGISVYPVDGADSAALVARADEAMYYAKRRGRNTFQFFHTGMSVFSQERLDFENDLRRALGLGQFAMYYQPKADVSGGRINSVEALVRWRHPRLGVLGAADFIPLAEEVGLIFSIGGWILREVCRQARQWQLNGLPFLRVAVNVSPFHFRQAGFLETVRSALADNGLEPRFLEVELTEATVMNNAEGAIDILEELSRMGVIVSIDDFGTGYSSMSYLRRFPIDKLKIDRSFIGDLTTNADAAAIVAAIISMAHSLRLKVVAEGVENGEQLERLRGLGCDQYQGLYRSAAVSPAEVERIIRSNQASTFTSIEETLMRTHSKLAIFRPR